ncbi:META domain-containing protein [Aporhodopirellula aestuarii]|uniref:META domain-containing protein n=1 Tax=Aporhodopirellula aestuarii TaxID=2950107 RepID=A0ABT0TZB9_9BACT|nr:META domain-containing protein [Aporhodopirellula aestuarii]MCM2369729.1 META domain-containing protein [Aporhodopirellula aestuarii]
MKNRFMTLLVLHLILVAGVAGSSSTVASDPLPSWNAGPAKRAIFEFVVQVSSEGSPTFVPPSQRIAVFDGDGTLWCEAPVPFQAAFVIDEIKRRAVREPALAVDPMVQAALDGEIGKLLDGKHHNGLLRILALTHTGLTTDEFDRCVNRWADSASHPRFKRPYLELTYQPMQELLGYLRSHQFECFIVSSGEADFTRVWVERIFGIPPQNVVGSIGQVKYALREGKPVLIKTPDHLLVDDEEGKPVGIHQFIGRRPIACFGNSDGDQAMLEYTTIGNPLNSFGLIVHHTDAEREYAYDESTPASGKLTTALEMASTRGWTVVDIKRDWSEVWSNHESLQAAEESRRLFGRWLAEDIGRRGVLDRAQSTLEIGPDGSVSGSTSVNRYRGQAIIDGNAISFGPLIATRRAGPPAMMDQESRFTEAFSQVTGFRMGENGLLYLTDGNGNDILRFSKIAD